LQEQVEQSALPLSDVLLILIRHYALTKRTKNMKVLTLRKMMEKVCSNKALGRGSTSNSGVAIVFDPPSNVRTSPNGAILCSVREKTTINLLGAEGSWYKTDACGTIGFIHADQLKF
jgi:hypothetical protein